MLTIRTAISTSSRGRQHLLYTVMGLIMMMELPVSMAADQPVDDGTPTEVVDKFHERLISVMKRGPELGFEGRYQTLKPVITEALTMAGIAQITLGHYWNEFSETQKKLLINTFTELSIATYADRFDAYSGEEFKMVSSSPRNSDVLVNTLLIDANGKERHFDYILRQQGGSWKIINIIVDGVSELAIRRSEYTSILRREGFDTLIAKLKEKIAQYSEAKAEMHQIGLARRLAALPI